MTQIYEVNINFMGETFTECGGFRVQIASDLSPSDFELMLKKKMKELR